MLDLIIKIILGLIAGYVISRFFPMKLQAIERTAIMLGSGIAFLVLATFFSSGFEGIVRIRENMGVLAVIAIIACGVQIFFNRYCNRVKGGER